jgi:anaerobic ribonucleoside-triphosphate reductase activating protein
MVKYVPQDTTVVFREIPDEVSLAVNISNCQNNCVGCFETYLKRDIGEELNFEAIDELIAKNEGITCFLFMGEGNDPEMLKELAFYIKKKYPELRLGVYSGREEVEDWLYRTFDYIKIGPYKAEFGPLNEKTTNQRLYKLNWFASGPPTFTDITYKFWNR